MVCFKVALIAYSQTTVLLCLTPQSDQCCSGKTRGSLWQSKSAEPFVNVCVCVCNPVLWRRAVTDYAK